MLLNILKSIVFCLFILCANDLFAEGGWYLLQPPLRQDINDEEILKTNPKLREATKSELHEIAPMFMGDWKAPLYMWTHIGSFDTASACESALKRLIEAAEVEEPELRRKYPEGYPTLRTTLLTHARCIIANDPRLMVR